MKKAILISILAAQVISVSAQTRADYDAAINKFHTFYNQQQADSVFSLFGPRIKSMLPLDKTIETITRLHNQFGDIKSSEYTSKDERFTYYKINFEKGTLTLVIGLTADNKLQNFRFTPYKEEKANTGIEINTPEESNIGLNTMTGKIYGTLSMPFHKEKVPVVLIIAGSGPTDRSGNCPSLGLKANTYMMLAASLLQSDIATVRYDKRGVGESAPAMTNEASLSFDDMVNDAASFIQELKRDPRFSKVIVLGHSEGSLIGMMAAKMEGADAFISVAGIGERADKVIEKQLEKQSKELAQKATIMLDSLDKGRTVENSDPLLDALFRPSIQPYMISWLRYDPRIEIKKLTIPVYILQGTTDIQVGVEEAEKLKKAYPKATLKMVTGMNHILKQAPADMKENIATYSDPGLPLCPGFMPDLVKFIKQK